MKVSKEHVTHPNQSFRLIELELAAFRGERHRHRQLELTWIEQGAGLRFVGDSVQPFESGDLVLLGPQLPHAWVSAAEQTGQRHAATVLQFGPELALQGGLPELSDLAGLVALTGRGLQVEGQALEAVVAVLRRMPGLPPVRRVAALLEVLGLLLQHQSDLQPIAGAVQRIAPYGRSEDRRRVDRVIEWIHQHMQETLTVEAASRLVHVSPASFSRYFSREVGKSFTEYVNDVRCGEASLRLRFSDRPVAVIARECGFETLSHFNRQFALRHGASPRELRRQEAPAPRG